VQKRRRSFLLSSALAAGGCSRKSVTQRVRFVIPGSPASLTFLPHTVAQQLNFYRKVGLLLAVDVVPGGTKGAQALLGGSADVVLGAYDHAIRITAQGPSGEHQNTQR
jgi:NitT/TauT family transport system substrate-binding protein